VARKTDKFPPLTVVSGGQDLLRRRFVAEVVSVQRAAGWDIIEVDGVLPGVVREAVNGDMFNPRETLAVVLSPESADLELLERHHTSQGALTTLLLHIEGEPDGRTKFGKAVKTIWASVHKNFPLPTEWKAPQVAIEFVQAEATRQGFQMPVALAQALMERSGTDLGVLAFEMQKILILAKLAGVTVVDVFHVKGGMAPIAEASVMPIVEALARQQPKKLLKALNAFYRTSRDDRSDLTIRISRLLASSITKWLQILSLDSMPPKAIAEELGVHPGFLENKLLPAARRWGKQGTIRLIADLAASERAVLNGAIDPWVVLTSRLLAACGTR